MEENKKERLGRLYALRAGLCALSLECKRLSGENERAKQVRTRIEDNTAELVNYSSIVSTSKKTYKSAKHDYNKAKREYDKKSFPLLCWTIAFLCFAAAALYIYYLRTSASENIFLYDVGLGALGVGALFSLLKAALINIRVKPLRKKMRNARELMLDAKTWIEESASGAILVKDENRELKETKKDLDASRDSTYAISLPFAQAFRQALADTFSSTVNESYYGALDFIIYEIETGAADDIASALLAVDAKKMLNALEEAVISSHEKIKASLEDDTQELAEDINSALLELEEKLAAALDGVLAKINKAVISDFGGITAVREELTRSCSAKSVLAALAACGERTSIELATDIESLSVNKS